MSLVLPTAAPREIVPVRGRARAGRRRGAGLAGLIAGGVRRALRLLALALGLVIMAAGFAIAPLPGPFGLPVAVLGLVVVLRNSMWAKRQFIRAQQARPNWVYPVRRLMRRKPEVAPVAWQQLLRLERLLLKREQRALKRLRRTLRRSFARRRCLSAGKGPSGRPRFR